MLSYPEGELVARSGLTSPGFKLLSGSGDDVDTIQYSMDLFLRPRKTIAL